MTDPFVFWMREEEAIIKSTVTDATWLVRRGYPELAIELRDEFLNEWGFSPEHWNLAVDELIEYVQRKGETPEISTRQLMAVRFETA
jgi:hypothetical protein